MNNIFNNLKEVFAKVSMHNSKSRPRQQLLGMSDRQLQDFGFSRAMLI